MEQFHDVQIRLNLLHATRFSLIKSICSQNKTRQATAKQKQSQGLGKAGSVDTPEIWSWGEKLHMALMSDSNGNDHLSNLH